MTAFETGDTVVAADLGHDARWPAPHSEGAPAHLTSAVVVPLAHYDQPQGVLAAYLHPERRLSPHVVEAAEILGAGVSAVLQELGLRSHIATLSADMQAALASRSTIEQAKGIVMAAKHCSPDEAFQHLTMLSNTGHLKLREVAAQVVRAVGG